ncbi:hypothetical protein ACIQGW_06055 [Lysinibacillus xylanilyticus]|uniref:hypothetical protein n=1 Tax=Lysinibacillus xylanilyticus TaxID=582475 RepID=UPI0037F3056B
MNEDKTLFVDDIYIIAPQLLVVYEDLIHIDLFTVTPSEISNKDANQLCLGIIASRNGFVLRPARCSSVSRYRMDAMILG